MFVDTSVLVTARALNAPGRAAALRAMSEAAHNEALVINRQVVREYLAVVTRPQTWASPLAMPDALQDVERILERFAILEDGAATMATLRALCRDVPLAGKQVHDANIVATMLAHGERRLLTFNARDFRRFGERIELVALRTDEPNAHI